ncbi:MAG: hypothetical protein IT289_01245 [Oligoflexia bacterium]|nr:hypothetical protein [Oligoflexia bacterium]
MKRIAILIALFWGLTGLAHEGAHGPEQKMAPHGGILRDGVTLMLELVKDGSTVKVFPLTHEGKPLNLKSVEINLKKSKLADAKKRSVPFKIIPQSDAFEVSFDKGPSHRYSLDLVAHFNGKENKASWQIELGSE